MKKQIIATLLAGTMLTAAAIPAQAAAPTGNTLDGYPITIHDSTTPAAYALGKDWPITRWYFFDEHGNTLGSIPNSAVMEIARTDGTDNVEWEFWLADAFNDYRSVGGSVPMEKGTLHRKVELDADAFAQKMLDLANEERIEHGLEPVKLDESMMKLAMIRAEETSELYSHTRPDGTRVSRTYALAFTVAQHLFAKALRQPDHLLCSKANDICFSFPRRLNRHGSQLLRWKLRISEQLDQKICTLLPQQFCRLQQVKILGAADLRLDSIWPLKLSNKLQVSPAHIIQISVGNEHISIYGRRSIPLRQHLLPQILQRIAVDVFVIIWKRPV